MTLLKAQNASQAAVEPKMGLWNKIGLDRLKVQKDHLRAGALMQCQDCDEEVDEVTPVKLGRKTLKLCEECAETRAEEAEIADQAQSAMRDMMEYKGS